MRDIKIPKHQQIVNKINAMQDFTYYKKKKCKLRYVVGCNNLYKGENPSMQWFNSNEKIDEILKDETFEGVGGWLDKENNIYYVDAVKTYLTLSVAMGMANMFKEKAIYDTKENKVLKVKDYYKLV